MKDYHIVTLCIVKIMCCNFVKQMEYPLDLSSPELEALTKGYPFSIWRGGRRTYVAGDCFWVREDMYYCGGWRHEGSGQRRPARFMPRSDARFILKIIHAKF